MYKLTPRNKILFQNNENIRTNLRKSKLKKKKWSLFKRRLHFVKPFKPEKRKQFFQKRLFEKQRFKFFYGCIPEYQLKNLIKYLKKKKKINIFQNLVVVLESRLDINVTRMKFAKTIFQAKQLINHKKIKVNDNIVNKPNFILKEGDVINIIK